MLTENDRAGKLAGAVMRAACLFSMMIFALSMLANVLLRYLMDLGFVWLQDLQAYSFFVLVVTAIPVAFLADRHVRLEYEIPLLPLPARSAAADFFAVVSSALFCVLTTRDVVQSWLVLEGSLEPGGLPGFFVIKTFLPVSFLVLLLIALLRLRGRLSDPRV